MKEQKATNNQYIWKSGRVCFSKSNINPYHKAAVIRSVALTAGQVSAMRHKSCIHGALQMTEMATIFV
jgi:hypothetical protein